MILVNSPFQARTEQSIINLFNLEETQNLRLVEIFQTLSEHKEALVYVRKTSSRTEDLVKMSLALNRRVVKLELAQNKKGFVHRALILIANSPIRLLRYCRTFF